MPQSGFSGRGHQVFQKNTGFEVCLLRWLPAQRTGRAFDFLPAHAEARPTPAVPAASAAWIYRVIQADDTGEFFMEVLWLSESILLKEENQEFIPLRRRHKDLSKI